MIDEQWQRLRGDLLRAIERLKERGLLMDAAAVRVAYEELVNARDEEAEKKRSRAPLAQRAHRHSYGSDGVCSLPVEQPDGSERICGAEVRTEKRVTPEAPRRKRRTRAEIEAAAAAVEEIHAV